MAAIKSVGYAKYRLSPLKKITDLAKQIRKKHPNMPYTEAVKKAGAQYRSGKTAKPAARKKPVMKKAAAKKVVRKKVQHNKKPMQGKLFGASSEGAMYNMRDDIERQIRKSLEVIEDIKSQKNLTRVSRKHALSFWRNRLKHYKEQLRAQNKLINQALR